MLFVALVGMSVSIAPVEARDSSDRAATFDAMPMSKAEYDIGPSKGYFVPFHDENRNVEENLYVEVYRPAGADVPDRLPTVLLMSPYNVAAGVMNGNNPGRRDLVDFGDLRVGEAIDLFVSRGYVVAVADAPGSGASEGCIDIGGPTDVAAVSRVVEWLGAETPWSNGVVGMLGKSYGATLAYAVATRGTQAARSFLKAIIPVSGILGLYDASALDGVTTPGLTTLGHSNYWGPWSTYPGNAVPAEPVRATTTRRTCTAEQVYHSATLDPHGDYSSFWADREYRSHVANLKAATLMTYGQLDNALWAMHAVGFFDRIPRDTPHKLLWGHHEHSHSVRNDWDDIAVAWFDRYLKGLPTGAEHWPAVQVQDAALTWRSQGSWPEAGTFGQLALGANHRLGDEVAGDLRYVEGSKGPDGALTYTTGPLAHDLRISGMPVLDLWVKLAEPDAHLLARLDVVDAEGTVGPQGLTGARSAQHLAPLADDRFEQRVREHPPVNEPIRFPVRFMPGELLAPAGSSLRLTVTWVLEGPATRGDSLFSPTTPSGTRGSVAIAFDCTTPSVLRFALPAKNPKLLQIPGEPAPPQVATWSVDGGVARRPVCGQEPVSPLAVTRGP